MRINKFIAQATGLSRRGADEAIRQGRVAVNGRAPETGYYVQADDRVALDGRIISPPGTTTTIMLNKPVGYVCSRDGQGSPTIYELLSEEFRRLKPVGRLDKNTSGLLLLTNDGELANRLTHPRYQKEKVYEVTLNKPLAAADKAKIEEGVLLDDGLSKFNVREISQKPAPGEAHGSSPTAHDSLYEVRLSEGRNRQIRRTFAALGYTVEGLHRLQFGSYKIGNLPTGRSILAKKML